MDRDGPRDGDERPDHAETTRASEHADLDTPSDPVWRMSAEQLREYLQIDTDDGDGSAGMNTDGTRSPTDTERAEPADATSNPTIGADADGQAADNPAIADTKSRLDAAYASGNPETIVDALREALAKLGGHEVPERQTTWRTIAQETGGEVQAFPTHEAAKRALGQVPGTELHHIVEQAQANPSRSGFDLARVNSTDNLTRIPPDVHQRISAEYSTKLPESGITARDDVTGRPWEAQYEHGRKTLNRYLEEQRDDDER